LTKQNPLLEISKLRDHLAAADKQITFLFGAGTSYAVKSTAGGPLIPSVVPLTAACKTAVVALGKPFSEAWDGLVAGLPHDQKSIEDILTKVRQMQSATVAGDTLLGLEKVQIDQLEQTIRTTISREVRPPDGSVPNDLPHDALARWVQRIDRGSAIEIFTTNYDTLIERAFEGLRVPLFDGFVGAFRPFFYPPSLKYSDAGPAGSWTRLWKIHGSVTWTLSENTGGSKTVIRGPESDSGEMILPSVFKYDESRKQPYVAILDRLRDVLNRREDGVLFAIGYSFSDQHVNEVIFEALGHNPRLHLFALCREDPPVDGHLLDASTKYSNLLVLSPSCVVSGGQRKEWQVNDFNDVARLGDTMSWPAGIDKDSFDPNSGKFELGDFNAFSTLLDSIAAGL